MLNWSYANGIGFTSFHVWCGDNPDGLSQYKSLGFPQIVANLQKYYPATTSASLGRATTQPPLPWSKIGGQLASGTGSAADGWKQPRPLCGGHGQRALVLHWEAGSGWSASTPSAGFWRQAPLPCLKVQGRSTSLCAAVQQRPLGEDYHEWRLLLVQLAFLGGQIASGTGPAASSSGSRLDVLVQGTNGAMYSKNVERHVVVQLDLPRWVPDLITRRDLTDERCDRRLCARR